MEIMIRSLMVSVICMALILSINGVEAMPTGASQPSEGTTQKSPSLSATGDLLPLLPDALHTATEIKFYRSDKQGYLISNPYAVLSEHSHAHFFHSMKATVCRHKSGFARFTGYAVTFLANGKPISTVGYYPDLGWLIEPHKQNGQVPDELRKWLYSLT